MRACLLTQIAPENRLLTRLTPEAKTARAAFLAVSFVQQTGMKHLFKSLKGLLDRSLPVTIYTSGYLRITDPAALDDLLRLAGRYESLRVYFNPDDRFHSKFFYFEKPGGGYSLFLGSSNVSVGGFADTGELNVHLRGKTTDSVGRDIRVVMENLTKDRNFRPLDPALVAAYRQACGPRTSTLGAARAKGPRVTLRLEEMPVYAINSFYTDRQSRRIEAEHPEWESYVHYLPLLRKLKRGDHFLCIWKHRGQPARFTTSQYVEHDRIPGVGTVASVVDGRDLPLARLAKRLKVGERDLMRKRRLDVYDMAILLREFPQTLG